MRFVVGEWKSQDFEDLNELINKTMNVEAMAMEKATGIEFENLITGLVNGSRTAITAWVWVLQKREDPQRKFSDVVFPESDFSIEQSEEEMKEIVEELGMEVTSGQDDFPPTGETSQDDGTDTSLTSPTSSISDQQTSTT